MPPVITSTEYCMLSVQTRYLWVSLLSALNAISYYLHWVLYVEWADQVPVSKFTLCSQRHQLLPPLSTLLKQWHNTRTASPRRPNQAKPEWAALEHVKFFSVELTSVFAMAYPQMQNFSLTACRNAIPTRKLIIQFKFCSGPTNDHRASVTKPRTINLSNHFLVKALCSSNLKIFFQKGCWL